jgi:hypothetical protein
MCRRSIRHSDDREDWKLRIARQRMYQTVPQGCGVLCFVFCVGAGALYGWVGDGDFMVVVDEGVENGRFALTLERYVGSQIIQFGRISKIRL